MLDKVKRSLPDDVLLSAYEDIDELISDMQALSNRVSEGEYQDIELIGEGGAKLVYLSEDKSTGRKVVRAHPKSEEFISTFIREAILHAHLEHPNIIPFYDLGVENGRPFFCMKLNEGGDLSDWVMNNTSLSAEKYSFEAVNILTKICNAVDYAHSREVTHLDLKPENIQISEHGEVLVGDWGLARANYLENELKEDIQLTGQFTRHGYLSGTPGYMAPEQCDKMAAKTKQSDVYAIGALLVFLFCKEPPVVGDDVLGLTKSGKLSYDESALPERLRPIARKALARNIENRYASVNDLLVDINAYQAGYLSSVETPSLPKFISLMYMRNKFAFQVGLIGCLVLVLSAGVFIFQLNQSEKLANEAREEAESALAKMQKSQEEQKTTHLEYVKSLADVSSKFYAKEKWKTRNIHLRDNQFAYEFIKQTIAVAGEQEVSAEVWALKGKLSLLVGNLEEAVEDFENAGEKYQNYLQVVRELVGADLFTIEGKIKTLREVWKTEDESLRRSLIFQTVYSSMLLDDRLKYIEVCFHLANEGDSHFTFEPETGLFDVSNSKDLKHLYFLYGMPIRRLDISNCKSLSYFRYLEDFKLLELNAEGTAMQNRDLRYISDKGIRKLNIAGSEVTSISFLATLPLRELNLAYCDIQDYHILTELDVLETIFCSQDQLLAVELALNKNAEGVQIRVVD